MNTVSYTVLHGYFNLKIKLNVRRQAIETIPKIIPPPPSYKENVTHNIHPIIISSHLS